MESVFNTDPPENHVYVEVDNEVSIMDFSDNRYKGHPYPKFPSNKKCPPFWLYTSNFNIHLALTCKLNKYEKCVCTPMFFRADHSTSKTLNKLFEKNAKIVCIWENFTYSYSTKCSWVKEDGSTTWKTF